MTFLPTNTQVTFAGERSQLPVARCVRLAVSMLGPMGAVLAAPVLVAVAPAVLVAIGWVEVGTLVESAIYAGALFATTLVCVAVCRRVAVHVCGGTAHGMQTSLRSQFWHAGVASLVILGTASAPFLIASLRHTLPLNVCDSAQVCGYVAAGVWCLLWPLVISAMAAESCDALDAISRGIHFLLSRPVVAASRILGSMFATAAIIAAGWALTQSLGTQIPLILAVIQATSFLISCYLLTYLHLREQVDAIEWDELPTVPDRREKIPLSGRAAAQRRLANQEAPPAI